jgi:hypothetical protein
MPSSSSSSSSSSNVCVEVDFDRIFQHTVGEAVGADPFKKTIDVTVTYNCDNVTVFDTRFGGTDPASGDPSFVGPKGRLVSSALTFVEKDQGIDYYKWDFNVSIVWTKIVNGKATTHSLILSLETLKFCCNA